MKPILSLLAVLLTWGHATSLFAQESADNELALVRQLRAKGWHDMARTRIEQLMKRGDPVLDAALPIEMARVNIAEARQKDPEQRFALFTAARAKLDEFITKNKGKSKSDTAMAAAELARLTSYHAQAILSKAMREDDAKSRHEKARPAETMFIQAGKDLEEAVKALDIAVKEATNADVKALLERELRQVRFDVAINVFDQARTYIDKSKDIVNENRANTMAKAKAEFLELRKDESSQIGWLANAWLMKIGMEIQTPGDVNKYYDLIMTRKNEKTAQPGIQPAVRLARYFAMQDVTLPREDAETIGNNSIGLKNPKTKMTPIQRLHKVKEDGESWVKAYPGYLKTYEGQGVLFELAYAYFTEARIEKDQKLKTAQANFDKATFYFDKLAEMDGDLAERARQMSVSIKFTTLDTKAELKTFDQYMMKALIDRQAVINAAGKLDANAKKVAGANGDQSKLKTLADEKKQIDEERKKALKDVITSLNKALGLSTTKTPVQKVDDARYYLTGAYIANGDPYRAAIVGEALGRTRTPKSSEGAATAIATYSALQSRDPNNAVLRKRLNDMVAFVLSPENQKVWKGSPVSSLAHYHAGLSAQRDDKKAKEAIAHLEQVAPDFTDFVYIMGQVVFIAAAAREGTDDKKEQKWYIDAALKAISRMEKIDPKNDSPSVITMYFFAKLEKSKYMYSEAIENLNAREEVKAVKLCNDMKKYVTDLRGQFDQLPGRTISNDNREQLEFTMKIMLKYADLGIAETKFRSDNKDRFDEVIAATKTVVDDALALGKTEKGLIKMKDYRVTGDILGLALRAHVQKGGDGIAKGTAILDVLKRLTSPEGNQPGNVVGVLLNDIAGQIRRMKEAGDTKGLAATKGNYTSFLDVIAKEFETKSDNASSIMLAHAYSSLDYPAKAAELFAKVKPPANLDKKVVKPKVETDEEMKARQLWEEEVGRYWGVQIEYIRALRATKEAASIAAAEKAIATLQANPNARFKIQAMMEKNFIYEDTQKYREAYVSWGLFMKQPALSNLQDKDIQKIYFDGYFYTIRTGFKMATLDPKIQDRQRFINGMANMIVKLETSKTPVGWDLIGAKIHKLLEDPEYKKLKDAYDSLKPAAPKKGSSLRDPRRERGERNASIFRAPDVRVVRYDSEDIVDRRFLC